ncbi:hypothetical protein MSAN_00034900 [Mycena sanguinolenta]|uniref:Mitochondrial carrier n=1 Tax=Mycena sanguinolenta TaxID=230812 RepID=A0A8H7DKZ9_9AGAR|nr:hypothetical protein MSAN_00034900 [Mycena sanguinolenta]
MPASALEYIFLLPALSISLAVVTPLSGVLVRFRANYTPRGLALDNEGSAVPHTGPMVTSYFAMFRRVLQIEGFQGLYKGLSTADTHHRTHRVPRRSHLHGLSRPSAQFISSTDSRNIGHFCVQSLHDAPQPAECHYYLAVTTPHKLPYFGLMKSLRVLLTPTERRKPWLIYFTPGLLASQSLHVAYVTLILAPLHRLLVPMAETSTGGVVFPEISPVKLSVYFVVVIVSAAILTPLEVMSTRLAIQRNQASAEYNSVSQEVDGDAEEVAEYAGAEEDVIGLRTEAEPYTGIIDCAKTIINEEGFRALYRAWWITLLGGLVSALA